MVYERRIFKGKIQKKVENFICMNKTPKKVTKFLKKMWIHFAQDSYPKKILKAPKKGKNVQYVFLFIMLEIRNKNVCK